MPDRHGGLRELLGVALLLLLPDSICVSFRQGLTEFNYIEGQNIRIDYREAVTDAEYQSVMTELVGSKVKWSSPSQRE